MSRFRLVILCSALLGTFVVNKANAQFSVGVRGGANFSNISISPAKKLTPDPESITNFHAGATVRYKFTDNFSLFSDVLFSVKGNKFNFNDSFIDPSGSPKIRTKSEMTTKFNYLEIPIMANLEIPFNQTLIHPYYTTQPGVSLNLFGGPYIGYMFGANQSGIVNVTTENIGVDTITVSSAVDSAINNGLKAFDLGIMAGLGFSFRIGERGMLFVDGRYGLGLMSLNGGFYDYRNEVGTEIKPDVKNSHIQVSMGYVRRIGRISRRPGAK